MDGEIRQNKATKEWVIIAPVRGRRPHDYRQPERKRLPLPSYDPLCPFCPGNEQQLPAVIQEWAGGTPGVWQTRVVPNKFPVLTPEGSTVRRNEGIYLSLQGHGHHEVIVESPRHDDDVARASVSEVATLVETYHQRFEHWGLDERNVLALLFRNHGPRAGASLAHPHSQLITTSVVPRHVRWRQLEAQRHFDEWGRCVYCDVLEFEAHDRRRVVLENTSFLAFVPFAADVPFETWVVPKRHDCSFGRITPVEKADLALALRTLLGRLSAALNDPDYNYVVNSALSQSDEPHNHWYVRIRPRLVTRAGFEIGSGIRINPSLPEADAAFLNGAG